eukprot:877007-Pleurochrysis_carterae.AAC.1
MVRARSCRSSSTNSGVRVAALIASSLMRGGSAPAEVSEREEYDVSCCRERVSARSAFTTSCGLAPSARSGLMMAWRSRSCCSKSAMTMDKRGEGGDRGSNADMSRSSMISAVDSSRRGSKTDARTG